MDKHRDRLLQELAFEQFGVFSRAQAVEVGFDDDDIRYRVKVKKTWILAAPGVYALRGSEPTLLQRAMTRALGLGSDAFASHRFAALLQGADGIRNAGMEYTVGRRIQAPRNTVLHYASNVVDDDITLIGKLRVATFTRIVVDLSIDRTVDFNTVEMVFECGQRRGLTSHDMVRAMVERRSGPGNRGIRRAREFAALLVDDGRVNHSELETRFFQLLRDAGLPLPARQQIVKRPDGRLAYADYAYDGIDGVIELLGFKWHSSKSALLLNAERSNDIQLEDKTVLQFTWDQVTERREHVARQVERLLCMRTRNSSG